MKVATPSDLGNLVQEARLRAGLTQDQLAQLSGSSRLWVNQVESGHKGASLGKVLQLLTALDLAMDVAPAKRPATKLSTWRHRQARSIVQDTAPTPPEGDR